MRRTNSLLNRRSMTIRGADMSRQLVPMHPGHPKVAVGHPKVAVGHRRVYPRHYQPPALPRRCPTYIRSPRLCPEGIRSPRLCPEGIRSPLVGPFHVQGPHRCTTTCRRRPCRRRAAAFGVGRWTHRCWVEALLVLMVMALVWVLLDVAACT